MGYMRTLAYQPASVQSVALDEVHREAVGLPENVKCTISFPEEDSMAVFTAVTNARGHRLTK